MVCSGAGGRRKFDRMEDSDGAMMAMMGADRAWKAAKSRMRAGDGRVVDGRVGGGPGDAFSRTSEAAGDAPGRAAESRQHFFPPARGAHNT